MQQIVQNVRYYLLKYPIERFLLHGPKLLRCFQGRPLEDVCGQLAGNDATFWIQNMDECNRLFSRYVDGYVVLFETIIYLYLVYMSTRLVLEQLYYKVSRYRCKEQKNQ